MAELHQPDVIVIDLVMEGSDGLEHRRELLGRRSRAAGAGDVEPVRPRGGAGGGAPRSLVPREGRGRRGARAPHRRRRLRRATVTDLAASGHGPRRAAGGVRGDRASTSATSTPIPSCRCGAGWTSGRRWRPTSRTPWCWPPPTPTGGRRRAPCCCAASTSAGCTFFTSYDSRKGARPRGQPARRHRSAAGCRCCARSTSAGPSRRSPRAESEAYFAGRPRGSQLAAWASHQSSVLADRAELEARFAEAAARFADGEVPCPPYWGGYRLVPDEIELWQGRPSRMHDRLRYERDAAAPSGWRIVRLSP